MCSSSPKLSHQIKNISSLCTHSHIPVCMSLRKQACHCMQVCTQLCVYVCVRKCLHRLIDNWTSMWVRRTDEKIGCSLFLLLATMVILMLFSPSLTLDKCALHLRNDVRVFLGKLNTLKFTENKKVNNYTRRFKMHELQYIQSHSIMMRVILMLTWCLPTTKCLKATRS